MAAIISTYRHDYIAPENNRYSFLKKVKYEADPCKEICPCVEERPRPDLAALGEKCETTKWTEAAPAGKVEVPRTQHEPHLISKDEKVHSCSLDQPNRFLKTIAKTYPDLYERLRNMPQDELRQSIENSRFRTTYQVDYCHLDEHPIGIYNENKERNDEHEYRTSKLNDPCEIFGISDYSVKRKLGNIEEFGKDMKEDEVQMYKPVKARFKDDPARGATSHWDAGAFSKQINLSEYMDTLARTGLIVIENNLHDHSRCRHGKSCNHIIRSNDPKGMKQLIKRK